jgi:tripartite-type tricarboxylate transporter receptor subunit TctC
MKATIARAAKSRMLTGLLACCWVLSVGFGAKAQDQWPSEPIKILVPLPAGGLADIFTRGLAEPLSISLGKPVIVENKPGANGMITAGSCASAPPNGYTLCIAFVDMLSLNPFLFKKVPYDSAKDFTPVTGLFFITEALVAGPGTKVESFKELIETSKAGNSFTYASPARVTVLTMEKLKHDTGAQLTNIPFKGGSDAVNAILGGHVQLGFFGIGNIIGQIRDGSIRVLAVDGKQRSNLAPNAPTFSEAGYDGASLRVWFGLLAPAGTPQPIISKLHSEIVRIASQPEFKKKFITDIGAEPILSSPQQFGAYLVEDRERGAAIVKQSGIVPE